MLQFVIVFVCVCVFGGRGRDRVRKCVCVVVGHESLSKCVNVCGGRGVMQSVNVCVCVGAGP